MVLEGQPGACLRWCRSQTAFVRETLSGLPSSFVDTSGAPSAVGPDRHHRGDLSSLPTKARLPPPRTDILGQRPRQAPEKAVERSRWPQATRTSLLSAAPLSGPQIDS